MNDVEYIALALARRFDLDAVIFIDAVAFRRAVDAALAVMTADEVCAAVSLRGLGGLDDPYAGLIARIKRLPERHVLRQKIAEREAERARWRALESATRLGLTLGELVKQDQLFRDEAEQRLTEEISDEEIRQVALDALHGRLP
ncbi:MAG TPA: hypothetical protein VEH29_02315 [Acidimicrobiales bacterium]|nr:hypothetical protein [Acidimicrobiales bacterium]